MEFVLAEILEEAEIKKKTLYFVNNVELNLLILGDEDIKWATSN